MFYFFQLQEATFRYNAMASDFNCWSKSVAHARISVMKHFSADRIIGVLVTIMPERLKRSNVWLRFSTFDGDNARCHKCNQSLKCVAETHASFERQCEENWEKMMSTQNDHYFHAIFVIRTVLTITSEWIHVVLLHVFSYDWLNAWLIAINWKLVVALQAASSEL